MKCFKKAQFMYRSAFRNYFSLIEIERVVHLPAKFKNGQFIDFLYLNVRLMFFNTQISTPFDLSNPGKTALTVNIIAIP